MSQDKQTYGSPERDGGAERRHVVVLDKMVGGTYWKRRTWEKRKSETWTQNSKQNSFVEDNNHLAMHVIGMSKENM